MESGGEGKKERRHVHRDISRAASPPPNLNSPPLFLSSPILPSLRIFIHVFIYTEPVSHLSSCYLNLFVKLRETGFAINARIVLLG